MIPFPGFFSSTKPWGTPLGPILFEYFLTIFVMIIPPAEDAFAFLVDVSVYPGTVRMLHPHSDFIVLSFTVFSGLLDCICFRSLGTTFTTRTRRITSAPFPCLEHRSVCVALQEHLSVRYALVRTHNAVGTHIFLHVDFVFSRVPPEGGSNGGDVSFWYAT